MFKLYHYYGKYEKNDIEKSIVLDTLKIKEKCAHFIYFIYLMYLQK